MSKGRIISAIILFAVLGVFGGVYQFYFKEKLEVYKRDQEFKEKLEAKLKELENTFSRCKPDVLIREWRTQVQPWRDAVEERAQYFNLGGWGQHELPPEEGGITKFWYDTESKRVLKEFYKEVGEKMGGYNRFPADIRQNLGIADVDAHWAGKDVTKADVNTELRKLSFGVSLCEMLLEAKIYRLNNFVPWEPHQKKEHSRSLNLRTFGINFDITAKNLVKLLDDKLRAADRYFNIDAIKITYPYIAYPQEPVLNVRMLLTQAAYIPPKGPGGAVAAPGAPISAQDSFLRQGLGRPPSRRPRPEQEELGFFGRAWKWFKRTVLYTN